jgi:DNA repair ATPase RecN
MTKSPLKEQFFTLLKASKSFSLLTPERQKEILDSFENASDAQYQQGMEALKKDQETTKAIAEKVKAAEAEQFKIANEIQHTLKTIKKHDLEKAEAKADQKDNAAAAELLDEIDQGEPAEHVAEKAKKKRKKFLGIF